eukprot:TRINITY_DN11513_c0_g2_i2.p1 TRINITY_DN11513_c0_g2~~TRINITY_DN11513_c0_g2_i2.p1  ORF type:complete len:305 (+),score=45.16 TRINITY_DN11513_c0_g2_i2:124-1038(+)
MARPLRPNDRLVQELIKLTTEKFQRHSRKKCVVAGTKLVQDLGQRHHFKEVLSPQVHDPALEGLRAESFHVAELKSLRRIAQLTIFNGLLGTLDMPSPSKDLGDARLLLCLDYVEDPGVLGTLLRTAVAFEWQAVFLLPNCADPFDPLAIRASQGAIFDLPFRRGSYTALQQLCERKGLQLCVSHSAGVDIGSRSYRPPPQGVALLLREEHASPFAPPQSALKIRVPNPWTVSHVSGASLQPRLENAARGEEVMSASSVEEEVNLGFDPRSLDVAVAGGILLHHIKHFHYPHVSRSPFLKSPRR